MSANLVSNLGGTAGFGEAYLNRSDDGYTSQIDIRSVFPGGLNFFGTIWTSIYINNNGNITFANPSGTYTPTAISGTTSNPIIAAYWADVDTRGTSGGVTPGGTSTGTNLMWYDLDPATGTITATWDDVGYYSSKVDKLNSFQLQLVRVGDSDFDIIFRYEDINWTTGSASGGSAGLGGEVARAGYSSGDGLNFFELPQSGNQAAILALESSSNIAEPGKWVFAVRNGAPVINVSIADLTKTEGNGPGNTEMSFDVILSSRSTQLVVVDYFTQGGTADATDFIPVAGQLWFFPGQTRKTVTVEVIGDGTPEQDEAFTVKLGYAINAGVTDGLATGTIANDDGVVINDVQVTEGTGSGTTSATFTVTLLSASTGTVTVNFGTVANTALPGLDYTPTSGTLTFAPGQTTKTVTVDVVRDSLVEGDETFNVQLSGAVGATIVDAVGVGTISNDDGFVVNDISLLEGSGSGTTPFAFNVGLLSALAATATVNYQVVGSSATAGSDFVAASGQLTFAAGQTQQQATINVNKDTLVEANETFQLVLSNATGTSISDATGIATILNDDGIFISDAVVVEGSSGTSTLLYTVTLSSAASSAVTVNYATVAGTATALTDYTASNGTLTFAAGETSKTIAITVIGDTTPESDETLTLQLSNVVGAGIVDGTGIGTIRNDDGLSINNPTSVPEGDAGTKTVAFQVTLSAPSTQQVRVDYTTSDGTATAESDYVSTSGTLTFAPGETSKTIIVTIKGDTVYEPNETFRVALSNPVGSLLVNSSGTVSLTNDDIQPPPVMSVSDVSQTEGNGTGISHYHFFVMLSRAASGTVTVNYATAAGTATSGSDFGATSGTLTFAAGETAKEVIVPVIGDDAAETNETFTVVLTNLTGTATMGDATGLGTILNDDISISVNDVSMTEGNSGTATAIFDLSLSGASPLPVAVDFATSNGSAVAPADYLAATGTVTFAPGETAKQVTVQVVSDQILEPNESFQLILSNPVYATLQRGQGTATVTNDDTPPRSPLTVPSSFTVTEDVAGNLLYEGTPFGDIYGIGSTLTVTLSIADGTITGSAGTGVSVGGTATARTFSGTPAALDSYFVSAGKLTYQAAQNNTAVRTLTTNVSDGSLSNSATSSVDISAVNDAPVNTVPGALSANTNTSITVTGVSVDDPDASLLQVTLSAAHGVLSVSAASGLILSSGEINTGAGMTFSGSKASVNETLNTLAYHSDAGFTGSDTITLMTSDLGATGSGGTLTDTDKIVVSVTSNAGNDTLRGTSGNDTIEGGPGINTAVYTGSLSSFTLTPNNNGTWTAKDNSGTEGTDTLSHIAKLTFADGTVQVAADLTSSTPDNSPVHSLTQIDDSIGQRMQKFFLAYYGRPADYDGLVYWKQTLASGLGGDQLKMASFFGNASQPEFVSLYGTNNNSDFVQAVYQNLFSHGPDAAGLTYWSGVIDSEVAAGKSLDTARAEVVIWIVDGANSNDTAIVNAKVASMTTVAKQIATYDQSNAFGDATNANAFAVVRNWTQAQLPGITAPDLVQKAVSAKTIATAAVGGHEVQTSASYTIPAGFTNLKLTGTTAITGAGNTADNLIYGNAAGSTLMGGGGNDCFVVSTLTSKPDRVADFSAGDQIAVDTAGFSGLKPGVQTVQTYGSVTGTKAALAFDQTTGTLYYDADGTGSQAAQAMLTLTGNPTLSAGSVWGI